MASNVALNRANKAKKDEFYTQSTSNSLYSEMRPKPRNARHTRQW